jgi:hypothetical protein
MDDDDFRDEITQLEARSEALTESIERCRKISLAADLIGRMELPVVGEERPMLN